MSLLENKQYLSRYIAPTKSCWKGRKDSGDYAYIHQVIKNSDLSRNISNYSKDSLGIVGLCSDEGVRRNFGRPGAAKGPKCLRECLGKLPVTSNEPFTIYDCGDVNCSDSDLESSQELLGKIVCSLLQQNVHPVVLGGGHEIAWGTYQGIASAFPNKNIGIINFDAHYDLRPLIEGARGSSGTPFFQISEDRLKKKLPFNYLCIGIQRYGNSKELFDRALELDVQTIYADEIFGQGVEAQREIIQSFIDSCDSIYMSICLDVFEASICPGVSAPQVLGLNPWQVIPLIRDIVSSKKTVCMDIAELSPLHDINLRSAKLGAALVCEYIHEYIQTIRP